jgi:frataxin-like iron-binding protein CyaY
MKESFWNEYQTRGNRLSSIELSTRVDIICKSKSPNKNIWLAHCKLFWHHTMKKSFSSSNEKVI